MNEAATPESDRIEGAPHPRETLQLIGQQAAETGFLTAMKGGRLHHGWLLTGPRGIGKATLAWRIARYLLALPEAALPGLLDESPLLHETLDVSPDNPVARRILAGSEPRLFVLRRAWDSERKRLRTSISVDDVRRLKSFFHLSAADGGRRVAIVDSADEMNTSAANALLKMLEEPPAGVILLLVSHQPSGLLPTIRSRCRQLHLAPLSASHMAQAMAAAGIEKSGSAALAALAGGSVGAAIRLKNLDGLHAYAAIVALFSTLPRLDRPQALKLAESVSGRGQEPRFDLLTMLMDMFLARLARSGVMGPPELEAAPGEAALMARLSPDAVAARCWADLHQGLGARSRHGKAVNIDPAALLLDMILKIDESASQLAKRLESSS